MLPLLVRLSHYLSSCRKNRQSRWRFSDLISYFCRWFRASADRTGHNTRTFRYVFFRIQTSQPWIHRKNVTGALRERKLLPAGLWLVMCMIRFAWAVRVAYFGVGGRHECVSRKCGNPVFYGFSITTTGNLALDRRKVPSSPRVVSPAVEGAGLRWARRVAQPTVS